MAEDIRLELLGGLKGIYDPRWAGRGPICDDFSRFYIIQDGSADVTLNERTFTLRPGNAYLFPSGSWARYHCPKRMTLSWVHFRLETLGGFDSLARYPVLPERKQKQGEEAEMEALLIHLAKGTPVSRLQALGLLAGLIAPFLPAEWRELLPPTEEFLRLRPVIDLLEANLERNVELGELAAQLHLHPTYLSNLFTRTYGIPPLHYHIHLRLRRARTLLLDESLGISEIARLLGYPDPFYFSRLFKRHVGVSPKFFRECGGTLNQSGSELKHT